MGLYYAWKYGVVKVVELLLVVYEIKRKGLLN